MSAIIVWAINAGRRLFTNRKLVFSLQYFNWLAAYSYSSAARSGKI